MLDPLRGEIWMADLDPSRAHEQAGKRPVLVVSADDYNTGPIGLAVIVPITSKAKGIRSHVPVEPGKSGLKTRSYVIAEQPRTIAKERLGRRLGVIPPTAFEAVESWLRTILDL